MKNVHISTIKTKINFKQIAMIVMAIFFVVFTNNVLVGINAYKIHETNQNSVIIFANAEEDNGVETAPKIEKGGAIYVGKNTKVTLTEDASITGKMASYGGAVYIASGGEFIMTGGTISQNIAHYGGAIYVESGGTCIIEGGTISENKAIANGPAIYVEGGATLEISENALIRNNSCFESQYNISKSKLDGLYYIEMGMYPQTYVGDSLDSELEAWYNSTNPTKNKTYPVRARVWEEYTYTDGNLYVRGNSHGYNSELSGYTYLNGDPINSYNSIKWFKVEPIKWLITNMQEVMFGQADCFNVTSYLVLTGDVHFNDVENENNWENSFLRSWLNETFYNPTFTTDEKSKIKLTTNLNNITGSARGDGLGVSTEDYIYVYSVKESESVLTPEQQFISASDFALSNNTVLNNSVKTSYRQGSVTYYWVRSAGVTSDNSDAWIVWNGVINSTYTVESYQIGVRPVMNLLI